MTREPGFYWVKMEEWDEPKPSEYLHVIDLWITPGSEICHHSWEFTFNDEPENRLIPKEIK